MKISDILKERNKGVSFEFFPPRTEGGEKKLSQVLQALKEYKPLYVSMTCGAGGSGQRRTKEAVDILLKEKNLVVMPHLTCIDAKVSTVKSLLDEYEEKGIENIMALRGDPPQDASGIKLLPPDFHYARDLVTLIKKYGRFCIGVAVYPEGHIETKSLEQDLEYTKEKIDAGADFAVTQMFFDNTYYYAFRKRLKKGGIAIPVLPGILPLTNLAKVKEFTSICRTTIPKNIEVALMRFKDNPEEQQKLGVDFTIKQCQDLIKNGASRLHFFTLNKPAIIKKILDALR